MTFEEFKKLCAEEIKGLPEKEVELLYRASTIVASAIHKKWFEKRIIKHSEK